MLDIRNRVVKVLGEKWNDGIPPARIVRLRYERVLCEEENQSGGMQLELVVSPYMTKS